MHNADSDTLGLPGPTEEMANATTECMAKCEQGNGTEAETAKFAACGQACIAQNFFSSTLGSAQGTGAAGAGNNGGSGSDAKPTGSGYVFNWYYMLAWKWSNKV